MKCAIGITYCAMRDHGMQARLPTLIFPKSHGLADNCKNDCFAQVRDSGRLSTELEFGEARIKRVGFGELVMLALRY
jgi:hypothetical protein